MATQRLTVSLCACQGGAFDLFLLAACSGQEVAINGTNVYRGGDGFSSSVLASLPPMAEAA